MLEFFFRTVISYSFSILPWFFLGIIIAYVIEKIVHPKIIGKYFARASLSKVILLLILGMISPLSILSFLPIANEFIFLGFNPGMLFSFLLAERAYDLQSFFIITSLFGFKLAILNGLAILISLMVVAYSLRKNHVAFSRSNHQKTNHFFLRQVKLLGMVIVGIAIGAAIRVIIPPGLFQSLAASPSGGLITAIVLGFTLYFGPILGNYPVAKALSDLGMSSACVFGFLTISPVFNLIVITLFGTAIGFKTTTKAVILYGLIATILTLFFSLLL